MTKRLAVAAVMVVLCALPASASAFLPPGFVGVSPQNGLAHKDFELMREAGIDNVRLPMYWSGIEATSPLVVKPDWSNFDKQVELAAEEGIRISVFIWGSPGWVAEEPGVLPVKTSWQRWAWQKFLREAARRYGPEGEFWEDHGKLDYLPITHWEIWNEENIVSQVAEANPAEYAKLIRISGAALHGTDPEAKVLLGGLFGKPLQIPPNIASGAFLERLYRQGNVRPYFDGVALHPYVAEAPGMAVLLDRLRRIMRHYGDAKVPLYVTELGWGSQEGPTRWERGPEGQANQLTKSLELLSANRTRWKVNGVWWFTWTDEGGGCQFCSSAGLLNRHYEAKPSWYRFVEWTGGEPDAVPEALGPEVGLRAAIP